MARQKVNGNGIRAAGNPDDEPVLMDYPTCPLTGSGNINGYGDVIDEVESNDNGKQPSNSHPTPDNGQHQLHLQAKPDATQALGTNSTPTNGAQPSTLSQPDGSASQLSFPLKLHRILDQAEKDGKKDVISWLPHGKAFLVHDVDRFVNEIMSQHFNQTKYPSFQRQLHMYAFNRITFGRDKGAYHHDKFQRGQPELCMTMVRTRVNGKGCRRPGDPDTEPDFYADEVDWNVAGTEVPAPVVEKQTTIVTEAV